MGFKSSTVAENSEQSKEQADPSGDGGNSHILGIIRWNQATNTFHFSYKLDTGQSTTDYIVRSIETI